ncbi:MAG TPA: hypothetical protein VHZ07_21090 [Bryobacteraceae bacterium]|jgi:hypothetical protein|nr:hypothetical protein [Bryobacteraceae bacterium]
MSFISHSPKAIDYSSVRWYESSTIPGVSFAIRRISLQQRMDLTKRIRELSLRDEFLKAGTPTEQLNAAENELAVRKALIGWGLSNVARLSLDGEPATADTIVEKAPEEFANEIITAISGELGLSDAEIKNF